MPVGVCCFWNLCIYMCPHVCVGCIWQPMYDCVSGDESVQWRETAYSAEKGQVLQHCLDTWQQGVLLSGKTKHLMLSFSLIQQRWCWNTRIIATAYVRCSLPPSLCVCVCVYCVCILCVCTVCVCACVCVLCVCTVCVCACVCLLCVCTVCVCVCACVYCVCVNVVLSQSWRWCWWYRNESEQKPQGWLIGSSGVPVGAMHCSVGWEYCVVRGACRVLWPLTFVDPLAMISSWHCALFPADLLPQSWYHSGGGRAVLRVPGGTRVAHVRWDGEAWPFLVNPNLSIGFRTGVAPTVHGAAEDAHTIQSILYILCVLHYTLYYSTYCTGLHHTCTMCVRQSPIPCWYGSGICLIDEPATHHLMSSSTAVDCTKYARWWYTCIRMCVCTYVCVNHNCPYQCTAVHQAMLTFVCSLLLSY